MKRNIGIPSVLLVLIALFPGCWGGKEEENKEAKSLYVLNVLDKEYYDDCRIAGSINVPFDQVEAFAKNLDKNAEVVVYCSGYSCTASGQTVQQLKSLGFENVHAYEAGMAEWYQENLKTPGQFPVEGSCAKQYLAAANEKAVEELPGVAISTEELRDKMITHGLLSVAVAPVQEAQAPSAAA